MSKKFNVFKEAVAVTDNNISIDNAKAGDYAFDKHKLATGTWLATNKYFEKGQTYVGTYYVNGTFYWSGQLKTMDRIYVQPNSGYVNFYLGGAGWGFNQASTPITITGGTDADSTTFYNFLSTYWTKEED